MKPHKHPDNLKDEVIKYRDENPSYSDQRIGEHFNLSHSTIYNWLHPEKYKASMAKYQIKKQTQKEEMIKRQYTLEQRENVVKYTKMYHNATLGEVGKHFDIPMATVQSWVKSYKIKQGLDRRKETSLLTTTTKEREVVTVCQQCSYLRKQADEDKKRIEDLQVQITSWQQALKRVLNDFVK